MESQRGHSGIPEPSRQARDHVSAGSVQIHYESRIFNLSRTSMTNQEKLQALFDAAMRSPEEPSGKPKRAVPGGDAVKAPAEEPAAAEPVQAEEKPAPLSPDEALDKEAAEELGQMLDERIRRDRRKRKIEVMVTTVLLLGSALGGTFWFVQDKARIAAVNKAMEEIRMAGDPEAMAAQYNPALEKIAQRGNQLGEATAAMGVDPDKNPGGDIHMEAEMKEMMGDDAGPTVGQRNKLLVDNFGDVEEKGLK
jgi:hypothetical protein